MSKRKNQKGGSNQANSAEFAEEFVQQSKKARKKAARERKNNS